MNRVIRLPFFVRIPPIPLTLAALAMGGVALTTFLPGVGLAKADEAAAATAPASAPSGMMSAADLRKTAEDFWHFGKIARYDLASRAGNTILASGDDPQTILVAFEAVAAERNDDLDTWFTRWQGLPQMRDVATKLAGVLRDGYRARRSDPAAIKANIELLIKSQRAFDLGVDRLRDSGEFAVPFMIDYLRDPTRTQYHGPVRRALTAMGRSAVAPLCAVTMAKDENLLTITCVVLGEIGYDAATPYLARLANSNEVTITVKNAASSALNQIGTDTSGRKPADLFYDLGDKFYYGTASIGADKRNPVGYIWFWSDSKGLYKTDVPLDIYNQLSAMRCAEFALKLGPSQGDALSLWLAANYQREINLKGATDPTRLPDQPSAVYYGVSSGVRYLQAALGRALHDKNTPLALKVIASLQGIIGEKNGITIDANPLSSALTYSDRLVRFEAACALAMGLPTSHFDGDSRVVPILAAAFAQTGQPGVILLLPKQDEVNSLSEGLKKKNMLVAGSTTADGAVTAAGTLPAVDVAIISSDLPSDVVEKFLSISTRDQKLAGAARVIITKTSASPYEQRKLYDPLLITTQATDAAGLEPVIESGRAATGAGAFDPAAAAQYAERAGGLLRDLALSNNKVMDVSAAKTSLLSALTDSRPDIVKLAGQIVSVLPDGDAQAALFLAAQDAKTPSDVKIALYHDLSNQAKLAGNLLDSGQVDELLKTVADEKNLDVRTAAAGACGALNLPADQAKTLIVQQARD
jgi:hypothetical protein